MLGIDPHIVKHEIRTYPYAKPIWKHLRAINPRKAPTIKAEVEKLLNVSFIYPIPLPNGYPTSFLWIKSKEPSVCVWNFATWTRLVLKITSPFLSLIRFLMSVQEERYFILWIDFQAITKSKSNLRTNTRWNLYVLGVLFHTGKCLSALKTPEQPSNAPWPFIFTISKVLSKLTLMIFLITLTRE